jgi:hypothetical protein
MQELWLPPNIPNAKAVGRFVDVHDEYVTREGERKQRIVTVLLHKIPGSHDVSSSLCKDNPDGHKLRKEWAAAWSDYQKRKAAEEAAPAVPTATEHGIKGTPIEHADFISKDRLAFFKDMGFLTIEQLAGMSDAIVANFSSGRNIRKKAAEFLTAMKAA